ncbi:putative leucine-rich repeat-containing protein DDB_G0290503 [Palaemon carinicauda]|uniref:putative leucine-rich repeat-containing protein DDB_G0290503 n=1 Tax=Palaemon carinicauda TaxID=392227 RepID=UPI0035B68769
MNFKEILTNLMPNIEEFGINLNLLTIVGLFFIILSEGWSRKANVHQSKLGESSEKESKTLSSISVEKEDCEERKITEREMELIRREISQEFARKKLSQEALLEEYKRKISYLERRDEERDVELKKIQLSMEEIMKDNLNLREAAAETKAEKDDSVDDRKIIFNLAEAVAHLTKDLGARGKNCFMEESRRIEFSRQSSQNNVKEKDVYEMFLKLESRMEKMAEENKDLKINLQNVEKKLSSLRHQDGKHSCRFQESIDIRREFDNLEVRMNEEIAKKDNYLEKLSQEMSEKERKIVMLRQIIENLLDENTRVNENFQNITSNLNDEIRRQEATLTNVIRRLEEKTDTECMLISIEKRIQKLEDENRAISNDLLATEFSKKEALSEITKINGKIRYLRGKIDDHKRENEIKELKCEENYRNIRSDVDDLKKKVSLKGDNFPNAVSIGHRGGPKEELLNKAKENTRQRRNQPFKPNERRRGERTRNVTNRLIKKEAVRVITKSPRKITIQEETCDHKRESGTIEFKCEKNSRNIAIHLDPDDLKKKVSSKRDNFLKVNERRRGKRVRKVSEEANTLAKLQSIDARILRDKPAAIDVLDGIWTVHLPVNRLRNMVEGKANKDLFKKPEYEKISEMFVMWENTINASINNKEIAIGLATDEVTNWSVMTLHEAKALGIDKDMRKIEPSIPEQKCFEELAIIGIIRDVQVKLQLRYRIRVDFLIQNRDMHPSVSLGRQELCNHGFIREFYPNGSLIFRDRSNLRTVKPEDIKPMTFPVQLNERKNKHQAIVQLTVGMGNIVRTNFLAEKKVKGHQEMPVIASLCINIGNDRIGPFFFECRNNIPHGHGDIMIGTSSLCQMGAILEYQTSTLYLKGNDEKWYRIPMH